MVPTGGLTFKVFWWRITMTHMVSYFVAGILSWKFNNISETYDTYMMSAVSKPLNSPWIASATTFQIITGMLWSSVLWPFKEVILGKNGWLKLWLLLVGLAIIGTEVPTSGSIEGVIYLKIPIAEHLKSLPEVLLQTLICSYLLFAWYARPKKLWNIIAIIFLVFFVLMSLAVLLSSIQNDVTYWERIL